MKIKAVVSMLVLSAVSFIGIAVANTGLQTVVYSTNNFSATFNGPVSTSVIRNNANTSTNYSYYSSANGVDQDVIVRFIDHDIRTDYSSSDFYADNDANGGEITNRSTGTYQGHPFTYARRGYVENGVKLSKRTRYIIVSAREVVFIEQVAPFTDYSTLPNGGVGQGDQSQWFDFEDSLSIK